MKPNDAWTHNSLIGGARMIQGICNRIAEAKTTTAAAKLTAREIHSAAQRMIGDLQTRVK